MKTASLMIWCCGTPARLVHADEKVLAACRKYGECLGIAFQMIDDIIDYDAAGDKPFAQDLHEGLVNYVTFEMLQENPDLARPIEKLLGEPESPPTWPWEDYQLKAACDRVRARAQAKLEVADQLLSQISKSIETPDYAALQALRSILVYLRERIR
jgi:geranylgeranyl pyrophosphate synthase